MRRILLFILFTVFIAHLGCSEAESDSDSSSATDVIERDFASTVDTLVLELSVQLRIHEESDLQQYDGQFIDPRQIYRVKLLVNGEPWGVFETFQDEDDSEAEVEVDGWWLTSEPREALLVATVGKEVEAEQSEPETIGDWVDLMQRYLPPGGYVAEIAEVTLRNRDDEMLIVKPGVLLSFYINDRDVSSTLGEVTVKLESLGGI